MKKKKILILCIAVLMILAAVFFMMKPKKDRDPVTFHFDNDSMTLSVLLDEDCTLDHYNFILDNDVLRYVPSKRGVCSFAVLKYGSQLLDLKYLDAKGSRQYVSYDISYEPVKAITISELDPSDVPIKSERFYVSR